VRTGLVNATGAFASKVFTEMTPSPDSQKIRSARSPTLGDYAAKLHKATVMSKNMPR
jgi:hypothetical protein